MDAGSGEVAEGSAGTIVAHAEDVDGDTLSYDWSTSLGTIEADGATLERLVERMRRRLDWSARAAAAPRGHLPVCFLPAAVATLLAPVRRALLGRTAQQGLSPVADRLGQRVFDPGLTLVDDPLLEGRPGSRPLDDEGVPSARTTVVAAGVVQGLLYDLESAARAGTRSTGHARRTTFGKPLTAWSNVLLEPGPHAFDALLAMIEDGLLVDGFEGEIGPAGGFALPVALGWRVQRGEITGRVRGAVVAGNAFELLGRLRGVGKDIAWRGPQGLPAMVAEGVAVAGEVGR